MTSKAAARLALFGLLAAAAIVAFTLRDHLDLTRLDAVVASAGAFGPLAYVATFALATALFVPGAAFVAVAAVKPGPATSRRGPTT